MQKPVKKRHISTISKCFTKLPVMVHEGCKITFVSPFQQDFCTHTPSTMEASENLPNQWLNLQSSAVLMKEECLGLVQIWVCYRLLFHGQELFSPSFLKTHDATLWITGHGADCVCIGGAFFVNCITALPPCLHTKYKQYCSDLQGHLRGMILPYNMHWDCVTILLEGKTSSDQNFE